MRKSPLLFHCNFASLNLNNTGMFNIYKNTKLAAFATLALLFNVSQAATVYTSKVTTGNWSASSSWNRTGTGSPVTYRVAAGHAITLDVNVSSVDTVWVAGTLNMANNRTLTVNSNGTVILDWGATIQGGSNNTSFIMIGSSYAVTGPFTSTNIITSGPRWLTASSATNALGAPQASFIPLHTLLPVVLGSIEVTQVENNFELSWTALGESNQSTFTIEVSKDGRNFQTIATVYGNGEMNEGNYTYTISNQSGAFYIRLSETNNSGTTTALAVKYVKNSNVTTSSFQLFPNLISANDQVNMVLPTAGSYSIAVYNMNMQQVATSTATAATDNEVVSVSSSQWNLQNGNYVVVVTGENGQVNKTRIVAHQ
jgi:methionine-rich copper-binding protein CopC